METQIFEPFSPTVDHYDEIVAMVNFFGIKRGKAAIIGTSRGIDAVKLLQSGNYYLYIIDAWLSYPEYHEDPLYADQTKMYVRYLDCLKNLSVCSNNYEVIVALSLDDSKFTHINELDFVFIDANHSFEYVLNDLRFWYQRIKLGGILFGHDWGLPSVVSAIKIFAEEIGYTQPVLYGHHSCWALQKKQHIRVDVDPYMQKKCAELTKRHETKMRFLTDLHNLVTITKKSQRPNRDIWSANSLDQAFALVASTRSRQEQIDEAKIVAEMHFSQYSASGPVLEIGCGFGRVLKEYAMLNRNSWCIGIDTSVQLLELANTYCYPDVQISLRLIINRYPVPNKSINYAYSHQVILHCTWQELAFLFSESSRVLVDGGIMVHSVPTEAIIQDSIRAVDLNFPLFYYSPVQICALADYYGFRAETLNSGFYKFTKC